MASTSLHASPPAGLRQVRQALLRPAHADDAAQLCAALEDALNTASFQDCGRLLLLRRLCLRGLPRRAPAAVLARALEQAWRELAAQALPASHPRAEAASAVYFASRFEARLGWLRQLIEWGAAPTAWFWPAALPELVEAEVPSPAEAVLLALLEDHEAACVQALSHWPDEGLLALAARIGETGSKALLAAVQSRETMPSSVSLAARPDEAPGAPVARPVQAALRPLARRAVERGRAPVPAWLLGLRLGPAWGGQDLTGAQLQAVLARPALRGETEAAPHSAPRPPPPAFAQAPLVLPAQRDRAPADAAPIPPPWRAEAASPAALRLARREPVQPPRPMAAPRPVIGHPMPWLCDARPTRLGGLLLLLNLLQVLGFEAWLMAQGPQPGLVDALLLQLLRRYGAADDWDPQLAWFEGADPDRHGPALRLWTLRQRRALRSHACMDLAELLLRQAWVSASPTHLDVLFPLEGVDLRLRRLGLDRDPGWLPWFGRIVAFHYLPPALLPGPLELGHG